MQILESLQAIVVTAVLCSVVGCGFIVPSSDVSDLRDGRERGTAFGAGPGPTASPEPIWPPIRVENPTLQVPNSSDPIPEPTLSGAVSHRKFAFWYEDWIPGTTAAKMKQESVVIGLNPSSVASAHAAHKRVLQYQSYYNATPNTALLENLDDLGNVGFQIDHKLVKSVFPVPPNRYVLCPNSRILRERVLQYVKLSVKLGYDGIFVDHTFLDPPAHAVCDASHDHLSATQTGGEAYLQLFTEVRRTLKDENPSAILIANPGHDPDWADQLASSVPPLWELADQVLWESYGYTSVHLDPGHDFWSDTIAKSYRYVMSTPRKAAKILALSYPETVTEARYAFAVARFFGFNWTANVGENQQGSSEDGGHFGAFLNEIPFELGDPVEPVPKRANVLRRRFQRGEVFINISSIAQSVTLPAGTVYIDASVSRTRVTQKVILQPRSAAIVVTR